MDEYLNNRHKEIFLRLLTNPADTGGVYLVNLQELVKAHPQSGLLRAMYGRALNESTPIVAAGYFDSLALYKLLHHYDSLLPVEANQVIVESEDKSLNGHVITEVEKAEILKEALYGPDGYHQESYEIRADQPANFHDATPVDWFASPAEEERPAQEPAEEVDPETGQTARPVAGNYEPAPVEDEPLGRAPWEIDDEDEATPLNVEATPSQPIAQEPVTPTVEHEPAKEEIKEDVAAEPIAAEITPEVAAPPPAPVVAERTPWELIAEEYAAQAALTNGQASHDEPVEAKAETRIDEETYDEITGIEDIPFTHQPADTIEQPAADYVNDLIKSNIANTDHFSFEHAFGEQLNGSPVVSDQPEEPAATEPIAQEGLQLNHPAPDENAAQHQDVSKYHDEKMPYTFMWWLDKTRKEHDATYQPYVKAPGNHANVNKPGKRDDLQQQYFENIFHLSPMDSLANVNEPQTVEFDMHNKEDRLIKRFITEDPHIHPPLGERLDTENKAKRSSEDDLDMVTETLARIYADQMLFPKAIATYRKLMLKFPEKSRYFASRIDALEKRTN